MNNEKLVPPKEATVHLCSIAAFDIRRFVALSHERADRHKRLREIRRARLQARRARHLVASSARGSQGVVNSIRFRTVRNSGTFIHLWEPISVYGVLRQTL